MQFQLVLGMISKNKTARYTTELQKAQSQEKCRLEIWAVKLRFLLIYEIMLKSIATARSECTAKHENKSRYKTDYITPDLNDFFGDD